MRVPQGFPRLPETFVYETEVHESLDREHTLFFNIFRKKNTPIRRALLIIHGQGEHGGRYQHFPHYLHEQYDLIIAPDLRGHGRSEGIRGHVESFDEFVDDAMLGWSILEKKSEGAELDWFGHSMGGLVTLRSFSFRPEIAAKRIILSAPLIQVKVQVPMVKKIAARLVNKIWGSLQMETGLDANLISHDPAVVKTYLADQLNHSLATPRFYLSLLSVLGDIQETMPQINRQSRLLVQLAGEDEIVDTPAAQAFFEKLRHPDKTVKTYPGLYHEIYNEPTREHVFSDWSQWCR